MQRQKERRSISGADVGALLLSEDFLMFFLSSFGGFYGVPAVFE